jgi:uncharacterized membrane protein
MQKRNKLLVAAVLLIFTVLGVALHWQATGADLASSYYGCRLLATHKASHLYSRDPADYGSVADPVWTQLARATGFPAVKRLHPFVQIPLWAWSLEPLCTRVDFPRFNQLFLCFVSFCLSAAIWLIARYWASRTCNPLWIAAICLVLSSSTAYANTMALTQTQVLFVLLTIAALVLAEDKRPILAGLLLASAAAVKITPGLLVIYWLLVRQQRAAVNFAGFSLLLAGLSVLTTGWAVNLAYLHNLGQISNMLLVSSNNQSLAAWWMGPSYPYSETLAWHALPLPGLVKLTSAFLSIASVVAGGLLDRRARMSGIARPPYGAAFALLGATVFATIAWDHYFVLLILPLMLLLDACLGRASLLFRVVLAASIVVVVRLNFDTASFPGLAHRLHLGPTMRPQFLSGLLAMACLAVSSLRQTVAARRGSSLRARSSNAAPA